MGASFPMLSGRYGERSSVLLGHRAGGSSRAGGPRCAAESRARSESGERGEDYDAFARAPGDEARSIRRVWDFRRNSTAIALFSRARLQRRRRRGDLLAYTIALIPRAVDQRDEPPGVESLEWGRSRAEFFHESRDLGRVGQRDKWDALQGRQDQEVQPHSNRELEVSNEGEQLSAAVLAAQY
jgi:hypothetical protein